MEPDLPVGPCLKDPSLGRDIESAARALLDELGREPGLAARRRLVRDGLDIDWDGVRLRSLWLVTHRGLRRAGVREHPASLAVLIGWRGAGLVQVRAPGARRTVSLAAWTEAGSEPQAAPFLRIPEATAYDTLADVGAWHLLAFHTHPGAGLVRRQAVVRDMQESWIEQPEEDPS